MTGYLQNNNMLIKFTIDFFILKILYFATIINNYLIQTKKLPTLLFIDYYYG